MIEITPLLDRQGINPLYTQLYMYIKEQIESGLIAEGAKLPSIRELSHYLKISKNTVEAAYQQLLSEGYVESKSRNGLIVLPLEDVMTNHAPSPVRMNKSLDVRTYRYDFNYGDIEWDRFPMSTWRRCLSDSLNKDPRHILGYGHPQGDEDLREEIAKYVFQSRGVSCSSNQILICSGTQHAISMLLQLLSLGGKNIAMEEPGYNGVRTVIKNHGCKITPISVEYDGLNIEELQTKNVNAVYVTPSHQFPLGMVLSIQKRLKLLQWADQNDTIIIEDDYDSEFRYVGQPIPSLKALDSAERVIYLGTFSKSFLPSARLSYMVLPTTMIEKFDHLFSVYSQPASPIIQQAMYLFMNRGHFAGHIRKMRRLYQAKHKVLVSAIALHMGDRVNVIGSKSGVHLLLDIKDGESSHLIEQAAECGVKVYSPAVHWMNRDNYPTSIVLLGFSGMNEDDIEAGVRILSRAWFGEPPAT